MTTAGESARSWTFSHRAFTPAAMAIVVAEAAWASLLAALVANAALGGHVSLPFVVVAVPGLLGVAVAGESARFARSWRRRAAFLAVVLLVGAALTAGVIGALTRSGWFWRVAIVPWTASAHRMALTAAVAWAVAVMVWGRGVWLGLDPPSFRRTAQSVGLGGVVFIGILISRAEGHHSSFSAATGATGWLLIVWFAFAATALALVRKRDLEQELLHRSSTQPDSVWLTVLGGPLLAVVLLALLLAVVFPPLVPIIGDGLALVVGAVGWLITTLAHAVSHLLHPTHQRAHSAPLHGAHHAHHTTTTTTTRRHHTPAGAAPKHGARSFNSGSSTSLLIVIAALPLVLGFFALVYLLPFSRSRRPRRARPADIAEDEERDTLFTWRHLGSQLRSAIRALLARLKSAVRAMLGRVRRSTRSTLAPAATAGLARREGHAGPETVRDAYRRMLTAARIAGTARAAAETTGELQGRLSDGPAASAADALAGLTTLYDAARYGELEIDESERVHAVDQADAVSAVLGQPASHS